MKLRALLKCLASLTCEECSARQHLPRRSLWVAAKKNGHEQTTGQTTSRFSKRTFSTGSGETIIQSTRPHVELPVMSLSDFMFSRFEKFGNKPALVSTSYSVCEVF